MTRKRPERGDCSLASQIQAQLQTCRIKRSLAIQALIESDCWQAGNLKQKDLGAPRIRTGTIWRLFEDSRCQALFLAKKEG